MFNRRKYRHLSEEALMAALQKGRHRALEELYLRHADAVRWYFFRMTGQDEELARDLCQDLFLKIAEQCPRFAAGRSFRTWMYSLAHNMCKNRYRHQAVQTRVHEAIRAEAPTALPSAQVIAAIDADLFRERLDRTLAQLDAARRSAFLLRHRQGLSLREIAEVQNCPLGTVKSRLHAVHAFLARELADLKPEILNEDDGR
ncbi:MAG: RNA polymerase sigma factor [Bacteroidota bacterium]